MFAHINGAFAGIEHQPFHWDAGRNVALLVHGFPGTPDEMRPVAEVLHSLGWTVRAVLLPGFGSDINNMLNRTHHDWMGSVGAELAQLRQQYNKVMLVGFSMVCRSEACFVESLASNSALYAQDQNFQVIQAQF